MACDAATLINAAYANGYAKMSDRDLKMATLASACAATGGIGGGGQIVAYTGDDPNSDGVLPANVNQIALAAKPFSTTYTWSVALQTWT